MSEPWKEEQARQEEMEEWADKHLPHCEDCGEPIHDYGYRFERRFGNDEWYCEDCIALHRKEVNYGE